MNTKKYHFTNIIPQKFFAWCREHKLYKTEAIKDTSRLLMIYNGLEDFVGMDCIVAFDNNKPIAIVTCEHREIKKEISQRENPDLNFINLGFVNIFVKKNYRRKGIAIDLVKQMEALRLNILQENFIDKNNLPYFVAREKAKILVSKYCNYSYAIGSDIEHRGRQIELDNIAYHKTNQLKNHNYQPFCYKDTSLNFYLKKVLDIQNFPNVNYETVFQENYSKKIIYKI